jgi:glycerophosphoryl diester phosphodiesterase
MRYAHMTTRDGLRVVAEFADGIGPNKELILPRDSANRLRAPTPLVRDAHGQGLIVHSWTFRNENAFLPADFQTGDPSDPTFPGQHGDAVAECALFIRLGVDGIFTDDPGTAVASRNRSDE